MACGGLRASDRVVRAFRKAAVAFSCKCGVTSRDRAPVEGRDLTGCKPLVAEVLRHFALQIRKRRHTVRLQDGGAIVLRVPIVISTGEVHCMTRSKACRGRNGIASFALGSASATAEVHAQAADSLQRIVKVEDAPGSRYRPSHQFSLHCNATLSNDFSLGLFKENGGFVNESH
jgi:hypothetical protein